ncbi:MAG: hypothetical protein LBV79_07225 [Candidatus Adiutrix sp.]|jgi:DNA-nicking Smr family endonuclease|nr:hypothetical protein [Candidatus Adiutrix sp.]
MAKKKQKTPPAPAPAPKAEAAAFNQPFGALSGLKKNLAVQAAEKKPAPKPAPPPPPPAPSDDALFMSEMADVTPLNGQGKRRPKEELPPHAWPTPAIPDEDMEVLRNLSDLVSGKAEFDLTYTDEFVEGQTRGLPPALMDQLRAGHIPFQEHLDLHGYTLTQAEAAVTRFILDSVALGRGCVL